MIGAEALAAGTIITIADADSREPGDGACQVGLSYPESVAVDAAGTVHVADSGNSRVRLVFPDGTVRTVAGIGRRGFGGDGGLATRARLTPHGLAFGPDGSLYLADYYNHRVRRVSPAGVITTVAGTGAYGASGDGGAATEARLAYPDGLAVDGVGNLYVSDCDNHRVRRVSADGTIGTVAGTGVAGYGGDGGPATEARLSYPDGVAVDQAGNLYIADRGNQRVRRVSPDGVIATVAGTGEFGAEGDGGPAVDARLRYPDGVAVDRFGNVYVSDCDSCRVRRVSPDGVIVTVAGTGDPMSDAGDGGPATKAQIAYPGGLAIGREGHLYIAERASNRIRMVYAAQSLAQAELCPA